MIPPDYGGDGECCEVQLITKDQSDFKKNLHHDYGMVRIIYDNSLKLQPFDHATRKHQVWRRMSRQMPPTIVTLPKFRAGAANRMLRTEKRWGGLQKFVHNLAYQKRIGELMQRIRALKEGKRLEADADLPLVPAGSPAAAGAQNDVTKNPLTFHLPASPAANTSEDSSFFDDSVTVDVPPKPTRKLTLMQRLRQTLDGSSFPLSPPKAVAKPKGVSRITIPQSESVFAD